MLETADTEHLCGSCSANKSAEREGLVPLGATGPPVPSHSTRDVLGAVSLSHGGGCGSNQVFLVALVHSSCRSQGWDVE